MVRKTSAMAILIMILAAYVGRSEAFCVYNTGKTPVSFFAWPVAAQSFKAVVQPGGNSCCNFQNPTCFAKGQGDSSSNPLGQCADVKFLVIPSAVDTQAVTNKFIAQQVIQYLAPVVTAVAAALAPLTGGASIAITAATAFSTAGLAVSNAVVQTGIPITSDSVYQNAINGGTVTWDGSKSSATLVSGCPTSSSGRKLQLK